MQATVTDNCPIKRIDRLTAGSLSHLGCYSVIIDRNRRKKTGVGKLGQEVFPAGTHVYTGSAMKGLGGRLRRQCKRIKKMHWHIDYLLTLPEARVQKIILY